MKKDKAYLVGVHHHSFRPGEPAEIVGVVLITPESFAPRLCYEIKFSDGAIDYVAIHDNKAYKVIGFKDILQGNIPKVN